MALGLQTVRVGVWTHPEGHTGCTVILPPAGTVGGIAVRGGAPGTREAALLGSTTSGERCHAVLLSGSSLFGLRAADGVVDWCESQNIGLAIAGGRFPIVGAAVVFDVREPGRPRLDVKAGWRACELASAEEPAIGAVGVGSGCTVGKEAGPRWCSPGGQGTAVVRAGKLAVGAIIAVNALGSVYAEDGNLLAGCRAPSDHPRYPEAAWSGLVDGVEDGNEDHAEGRGNTVIGCIVTNARLGKAEVCRVSDLAHTGIARTVSPVHTSLDGDALFTLATGEVETRLDLVAHLAADAVARAVRSGVRSRTTLSL